MLRERRWANVGNRSTFTGEVSLLDPIELLELVFGEPRVQLAHALLEHEKPMLEILLSREQRL
jgi:hypothetical protein